MHLLLDGNGSMLIQLVNALKRSVLSGEFPPDYALPPTRQLAAELGVARNTVVAAYEQLQAEGLLEARIGAGTFVSSPGTKPFPQRGADAQRHAPAHCAPPSAYAARLRSYHDYQSVPGRRSPETRIAFLYGEHVAHPLLASAWRRELTHASDYCRTGYPSVLGLLELRIQICIYLGRYRGIRVQPEEILVVAGTQQALTLTARVLLDAGDHVVIEDPHYYAMRTALQTHGARVEALAVDSEGLQCDLLPAHGPRLICMTPSHQFPTGAVLSQRRRHQVLQYAERHDSWIFEDDYDSEFRVSQRSLPALHSLDLGGRVIYSGTFSKSLFPALRLGYLIPPPALRRDFIAAKFMADMGSPALEQLALANFMANGGFEKHLRRSGKQLRQKRTHILDGLRRISRGRLDIVETRSGMHVVVWLKHASLPDVRILIETARKYGLGLFSIDVCYQAPLKQAGLLMGYGSLSTQEISEGLRILEACLDRVCSHGALRGIDEVRESHDWLEERVSE